MHAIIIQVAIGTSYYIYNHIQVNMDVLFYQVQILHSVCLLFHSNTTAKLVVCTTFFHQGEGK